MSIVTLHCCPLTAVAETENALDFVVPLLMLKDDGALVELQLPPVVLTIE